MLQAGLGPLGQKYVEAVLRGARDKQKSAYAGTPDLYELIFKRIPDDALYTEDDMHKDKSMLLATNVQTQASFVGPIIEQQGIQVQIRNRR
ncbi:hypothetical protein G5I_05022 [Acromyrmex echinatior]|uniref:DUF8207 domain-containing protein n=1 Tax=Acromyrmex echinatior TaxID=103372 RepID=F4WH67_ACREC|nr:hypothetical protein G5I_05022 [Acromyrmex echinatior]